MDKKGQVMPTYETGSDRENQRQIIGEFCTTYPSVYIEFPQYAAADFVIYSDRGAAFVEVKDRPTYSYDALDSMGGYMLSLRKWDNLHKIAEAQKTSAGLVVRLNGDIYHAFWTVRPEGFRVAIGGRRDRPGDKSAIEECVYVPMNSFRRMKELSK